MIVLWPSMLIGLLAYLQARSAGPREAFLGYGYLLAAAAVPVLANELGFDASTVFRGLATSAVTLGSVLVVAVAIAATAALFARWSLKLTLSPLRVGLIYFGASLLLINTWAYAQRLKGSS